MMGYVRKAKPQHRCRLPEVLGTNEDWEFPEGDLLAPLVDVDRPMPTPRLKPGRRLPQVGDVWECDECGRWYELSSSPYDNVLIPEWKRRWRPWWR